MHSRTVAVSLTMSFGRLGATIGNLVFPYLLGLGCAPPFFSIGSVMIGKLPLITYSPTKNRNTVIRIKDIMDHNSHFTDYNPLLILMNFKSLFNNNSARITRSSYCNHFLFYFLKSCTISFHCCFKLRTVLIYLSY